MFHDEWSDVQNRLPVGPAKIALIVTLPTSYYFPTTKILIYVHLCINQKDKCTSTSKILPLLILPSLYECRHTICEREPAVDSKIKYLCEGNKSRKMFLQCVQTPSIAIQSPNSNEKAEKFKSLSPLQVLFHLILLWSYAVSSSLRI